MSATSNQSDISLAKESKNSLAGVLLNIAENLKTIIVNADHEKRGRFTQEYVAECKKRLPDYNVVIIHTAHNRYGFYEHQHLEFPSIAWSTIGFEVYISKIGDPFFLEKLGDGGYQNWAFSGYNRDGDCIYSQINMNNFQCKIQSLLSNQVINVEGNSPDSGARIIQWPNNDDANSKWNFIKVEPGVYKIRSISSGLELNVQGASYENGTQIIQYQQSNDAGSKWRLVLDEGNGRYRIKSVLSGKVLNVAGASRENGASIIQYNDDKNDPGNFWTFLFP